MENNILFDELKNIFADKILNNFTHKDLLAIDINGKDIHLVCEKLKNSEIIYFNYLTAISGVDYLNYSIKQKERFAVIYIFYNIDIKTQLKIRAFVPENDLHIPSITDLFMGANWLEREVYDMFGVIFDNHPDLKRILMPDYYEYHPLRKDYPLKGKGERVNFPKYQAIEVDIEKRK